MEVKTDGFIFIPVWIESQHGKVVGFEFRRRPATLLFTEELELGTSLPQCSDLVKSYYVRVLESRIKKEEELFYLQQGLLSLL